MALSLNTMKAINSILTGLPVQLHGGSISSVTARIPWPNPLTSTLGFSIQSLHLTFHLNPFNSESAAFSSANLADSVVSVAESFLHDELTPREEATLRESFHPDLASSLHDHTHTIPGSMDPFLRATADEEFHTDMDPAGVSIFATLIERLLARFEFDAVDTKITLIHPDHASFTVYIAEVRYGTENVEGDSGSDKRQGGAQGSEGLEQTSGETRKASISGFSVSVRDLHPLVLPSPICLTPSTASPVSPSVWSHPPHGILSPRPPSTSSASSSSSLDEDTQMLMSQSLAYLPPRAIPVAPSPLNSMTSSMFLSAVSTPFQLHDHDDHGSIQSDYSPLDDRMRSSDGGNAHLTIDNNQEDDSSGQNFEKKEEEIFSFGGDPIVIRLITPPVPLSTEHAAEAPSPSSHPPFRGNDKPTSEQKVTLTLLAGVLACAFRAWHVRSVLDILDALSTHHTPTMSKPASASSAPKSIDTMFGLGVDVSVKMRGIVILLLPSEHLGEGRTASSATALEHFFTRPLALPRLAHGCVRIFLDNIAVSFSISSSPTLSVSAAAKVQPRATRNSTTSTRALSIIFTLNDISAFVLYAIPQSANQDKEVSAAPILITDNNLPTQYAPIHIHPDPHAIFAEGRDYPQLADFCILDWTAEEHRSDSTKLSTWRTKVKSKAPKRRESQTAVVVGIPSSPSRPQNVPQVASGFDAQVLEQTYHSSVIVVNANFTLGPSVKQQAGEPELDNCVEANVVPLHVYLDLGLALGTDALSFLNEMAGGDTDRLEVSHEDEEDEDNDSDEKEIGAPPSFGWKHNTTEYERERQRLEMSVLDDLNLELDYRNERPREAPKKSSTSASRGQGVEKVRIHLCR